MDKATAKGIADSYTERIENGWAFDFYTCVDLIRHKKSGALSIAKNTDYRADFYDNFEIVKTGKYYVILEEYKKLKYGG